MTNAENNQPVRYDATTTAIADAMLTVLRTEADLVDVFRDDDRNVIVVLRTIDDTELMLRVVDPDNALPE